MTRPLITAERLRDLLAYDPSTGIFTWLVSRRGHTRAGDTSTPRRTHGYLEIKIDGRKYRAHRLAWLYVNGQWPKADIDHINGSRTDNRIANLRDVSRSVNLENQRTAKSNKKSSLPLGVHLKGGRFAAQICVRGQRFRLGHFSTPTAAHAAYLAAKRQLHEGNTL